jgi:hypothetical protein
MQQSSPTEIHVLAEHEESRVETPERGKRLSRRRKGAPTHKERRPRGCQTNRVPRAVDCEAIRRATPTGIDDQRGADQGAHAPVEGDYERIGASGLENDIGIQEQKHLPASGSRAAIRSPGEPVIDPRRNHSNIWVIQVCALNAAVPGAVVDHDDLDRASLVQK